MLKIKFIVVDRTRSPFLKEGVNFYLGRLQKYTRVECVEVKPAKIRKSIPDKDILTAEGQNIERKIGHADYLVTLDRAGHHYNSEEFSDWLNRLSISVNGWVCFVIGGPLGLSKEIIDRADKVLSLSRLTLTHEMSRIFIMEQVYRAFTIMKGEKYHK
jgi:23S rRNA (pseudouridine1915-N3)-methyltransferase